MVQETSKKKQILKISFDLFYCHCALLFMECVCVCVCFYVCSCVLGSYKHSFAFLFRCNGGEATVSNHCQHRKRTTTTTKKHRKNKLCLCSIFTRSGTGCQFILAFCSHESTKNGSISWIHIENLIRNMCVCLTYDDTSCTRAQEIETTKAIVSSL